MSVKRMEIKLQPQFILSIYSILHKNQNKNFTRVGIKNLPKKTRPIEPGLKWVFFNFLFFKVLKHFISIILIVIVLLNILPCSSKKKYAYIYISWE